jgi:hypothetical protein
LTKSTGRSEKPKRRSINQNRKGSGGNTDPYPIDPGGVKAQFKHYG